MFLKSIFIWAYCERQLIFHLLKYLRGSWKRSNFINFSQDSFITYREMFLEPNILIYSVWSYRWMCQKIIFIYIISKGKRYRSASPALGGSQLTDLLGKVPGSAFIVFELSTRWPIGFSTFIKLFFFASGRNVNKNGSQERGYVHWIGNPYDLTNGPMRAVRPIWIRGRTCETN